MKLRMLLVVACLLIGSAWKPATCRAQAEVLPDHFELTNVEPLAQQVNGVTWELDRGQLRGGGTPGVSSSSSGTTLGPKSASLDLSTRAAVEVPSGTAAARASGGKMRFQEWLRTMNEVIGAIALLTYKTALIS
jgi:hypothetical protein